MDFGSMTTVFESYCIHHEAVSADTHVLIVGAGEYPCLLGGDPARLLAEPMALGQLTFPPRSAVAMANWFLGRYVRGAEGDAQVGFHNPHAPLASAGMLASPSLSFRRQDEDLKKTTRKMTAAKSAS